MWDQTYRGEAAKRLEKESNACKAATFCAVGSTLAVIGMGTMYKSAGFAMMIGLHLPVVAIAVIVAAGVLMAAYGLYLTMQLCCTLGKEKNNTRGSRRLSAEASREEQRRWHDTYGL